MSDNSSDGSDKLLKFPDLEIFENEYHAIREIEDLLNQDAKNESNRSNSQPDVFELRENISNLTLGYTSNTLFVKNGHVLGLKVTNYQESREIQKEISAILSMRFPKLEVLHVRGCAVFEKDSRLRSLKQLLLFGDISAESLISVSRLSSLTELTLKYYDDENFDPIPAEIGNLVNLRKLKLDLEDVKHDLPYTLIELQNLEILEVWDYQNESFANRWTQLTNLKKIECVRCLIPHIPDSIANMVNLETIDLSAAKTETMSNKISELKSLKKLKIGGKLKEIPLALTELIGLEELDLSGNEIQNIPSEIGNLINLKILLLDSNDISTIPSEIGKLKNLEELNLSYNAITEIPSEIGNLSKLKEIRLEMNKVSNLPLSILKLTRLKVIELNDNMIMKIPIDLLYLPNLKDLALGFNKMPEDFIGKLKTIYFKLKKEREDFRHRDYFF